MDCADIRRVLLQGTAIGPEAKEHAAQCVACEALLVDGGQTARRLGQKAEEAIDLDAALAGALAAVAEEVGIRARLRSARTCSRMALVAVVGAVVALGFLALRPRADLSVYPEARLSLTTTLLLAAAATALGVSARPIYLPAWRARRTVVVLVLMLAVPFVLAALPQAHELLAVSQGGVGDDFWPRVLRCVVTGLLAASPIAATIWLVDRGSGRWIAAAVAAGAMGTLVLELHCPLTARAHLLIGHATIAPLAAVVAAMATRMRR